MKNEKKKYSVSIFGDQYTLVSDEPSEHVMRVAALVDSLMRDAAEASKQTDTKKIAVLAALQIADRLVSLETANRDSKSKYEDLANLIDRECAAAFSSR